MTKIRSTDEQHEAAEEFLGAGGIGIDPTDVDNLALLFAYREHAVATRLTRTYHEALAKITDQNAALATVPVPVPVVEVGPWVVVDRSFEIIPVYAMPGDRWTHDIAHAAQFIARAAADANVRRGERVETLAEATAKVKP